MYFIDAIRYPYNSPGVWGKIGMAFLLMLIPVINILGMIVLVGYGMKIISSAMHNDENLPEFEIGADFMRGIIVFVVGLVYEIPSMILSAVMTGMMNSGSSAVALIILVMIVVSIVTGLLLTVALLRYAASGDTNVFMAIGENFGYLSGNPGTVVMFIVNGVLFGIVMGIIVSIGFVLLIIPGIILSIGSIFSSFYLYARFGMELGIGEKAKTYV